MSDAVNINVANNIMVSLGGTKAEDNKITDGQITGEEEQKKEEKESVYSYHTFFYPFIWEGERHDRDFDYVVKCLEQSSIWKNDDIEKNFQKFNMIDQRSHYAAYQYFNDTARSAILGLGDNGSRIQRCYAIESESKDASSEYIITKNKQDMPIEYHLCINAVRLKIFNTGVAVLIFECENFRYRSLEDVKAINEYGRRVLLPFIPENPADSVCADKITIKLHNICTFEENFEAQIKGYNSSRKEIPYKFNAMSSLIIDILNAGSKGRYEFTTDKSRKKNRIYITSALDDRMYVSCVLTDKKYSEWFKDYDKSEEKIISLYELGFVDCESACTCQSESMRHELIEQHIYKRWIDYGTIYISTAQAFVCISDFIPNINTFLTMYVDMCILTIVQRASLVNFQNEALQLTSRLEERGVGMDKGRISRLMDLQERFIAFQNQLNLREISSQEQAVDLYTMLRASSYVDELHDAMAEQMDALYAAANTNQDFGFNKWALILAIVALGLDTYANIMTFLSTDSMTAFARGIVIAIVLLALLIGIVISGYIFSRKRNRQIVKRERKTCSLLSHLKQSRN